MIDTTASTDLPETVVAIRNCGYAIWAGDTVPVEFRSKFDPRRIPVSSIRSIRIWGLQVDDERELPGHERTQIPDEQLWEINLVALDGTRYEVESRLLMPAP